MNAKIILAFCLLLMNGSVLALPTAKITIKVIDEQGRPIEGAKASLGFTKPLKSGWGTTSSRVSGLTNAEGFYTGKGEGETFVSYGAIKEGYYGSGNEYNFKYNVSGMPGFRKWQPWNPTVELVLKKIKQPIPLYAVNLDYFNNYKGLRIPILDEFVGFDLMARDWVAPYGKGAHGDFLVKLSGEFSPEPLYSDQTLTIKFSNPGDGIQPVLDTPDEGSQLRLPHHAPMEGYQPGLVQRSKSDRQKIYIDYKRPDQNFFFRVRTETDTKGNIVSALYGKIHGNIEFSMGSLRHPKKSSLAFTYYLNPTPNDTNLEFDPKKNLFIDLKDPEKVWLP